MLKFEEEPEEGTPTLGVVYHVVWQSKIHEACPDLKPIGYVVEVPDEPNFFPDEDEG